MLNLLLFALVVSIILNIASAYIIWALPKHEYAKQLFRKIRQEFAGSLEGSNRWQRFEVLLKLDEVIKKYLDKEQKS